MNTTVQFCSINMSSFLWKSFITQDGDSALTLAARDGLTDVVMELVKAGANLDLQNNVKTYLHSSSTVSKIGNAIFTLSSGWRLSCHHFHSESATSHSEGASEGRE